jgi:hypothetical protein
MRQHAIGHLNNDQRHIERRRYRERRAECRGGVRVRVAVVMTVMVLMRVIGSHARESY